MRILKSRLLKIGQESTFFVTDDWGRTYLMDRAGAGSILRYLVKEITSTGVNNCLEVIL